MGVVVGVSYLNRRKSWFLLKVSCLSFPLALEEGEREGGRERSREKTQKAMLGYIKEGHSPPRLKPSRDLVVGVTSAYVVGGAK